MGHAHINRLYDSLEIPRLLVNVILLLYGNRAGARTGSPPYKHLNIYIFASYSRGVSLII
jgi:hypothetical protein